MLVLLTTANYPDVMLPAYDDSYWNMLFFVSYLIIGLYLLLNFLLATVYNQFKNRLELQHQKIVKKTYNFLKLTFDEYDEEKKGYLSYLQVKKFFSTVLETNLAVQRNFEALIDVFTENQVKDISCIKFDKVVEILLVNDGCLSFNTKMLDNNVAVQKKS